MYAGGKDYWESHGTFAGKKDHYSEGSVADRAGDYESLGFSNPKLTGKKTAKGYGFGSKKKKAKRMGGGY